MLKVRSSTRTLGHVDLLRSPSQLHHKVVVSPLEPAAIRHFFDRQPEVGLEQCARKRADVHSSNNNNLRQLSCIKMRSQRNAMRASVGVAERKEK